MAALFALIAARTLGQRLPPKWQGASPTPQALGSRHPGFLRHHMSSSPPDALRVTYHHPAINGNPRYVLSLALDHTTINIQGLACDIHCIIGDQIYDRAADIFNHLFSP